MFARSMGRHAKNRRTTGSTMKIVPRITATLAHENASKIERVVSLRLTSKKKTAISLFRKTRTGCFPTQVRHASAYRRPESCGVKCVHMVSATMSASISPDTASDPARKHVSNTETTEIQRSRLPSSHTRHTALFSDSVGRKSSWSQISRGEDACADHFRILSRLPFSYEPREKHRHRCVPQRDRRETTSQQSSTLILGVRASRHPSPVPPCKPLPAIVETIPVSKAIIRIT